MLNLQQVCTAPTFTHSFQLVLLSVCVQEASLARDEAERMASLADSEAQRCLALEREMLERMEESGGSGGALTQQALADKDR